MTTNLSISHDFRPLDGAPVIDSLKVRIPLDQVQILDQNISTHWQKVNDEGEILEHGYNKGLRYNLNGISAYFGIESQVTASQDLQEFLVVLVNAKTLRERYFEGITLDNVELVYDYLIGLRCVDFSLTSFLSAESTDIDWKKDAMMTRSYYDKVKKQMHYNTKFSRDRGVGVQVFSQKDNDGIQWSDRRTTKYKTAPYLKLYHKEIELSNHSEDFASTYLDHQDTENRVRIETTIKNKKHCRALGINDTSLSALLSLSAEDRERIIAQAMKAHFEPRRFEIKNQAEMKPNQRIIYNAVVTMLSMGMSYVGAREQLLSNFDDRSAKSKKGAQLDEMYRVWIKDTDIDKEVQNLNDILDYLKHP